MCHIIAERDLTMFRKQTAPAYPLHTLCQDPENLSNNALQECLRQISDINALDDNDFTALDYAVSTGSETLVNFLLERDALPSTQYYTQGVMPIVHRAIKDKHEKIALILLKKFPELEEEVNYYENTPLLFAIVNGCHEIADYLINRKSTINVANSKGQTPLWAAAGLGLESMVSRLLANDADWAVGTYSVNGSILPITVAASRNYYKIVDLLSEYPYSIPDLTLALHYTTSSMTDRCRDSETRKNMAMSSKKLLAKLSAMKSILAHEDKNLILEDANVLSWQNSFKLLFGEYPNHGDEHPNHKDAAIRHALASMIQLLSNPKECLPYLRQISERLEVQWQKEMGSPFPTFDKKSVDLWSHHNHVWPIPNEKFRPLKKYHMLSRIVIDIFKQFGMGEEQTKWTGFVPAEIADEILGKCGFFTENKQTIGGVFHGNTHGIQWAILLLAILGGVIPLSYKNERGQDEKLEPREVFAAIVRKDLRFDGQQTNSWSRMLDSFSSTQMSFRQPHALHSYIMTGKELSDTALQQYMLWSFGQFEKVRALYNHIYNTNFSNMELCEEVISNLYVHLFGEFAELAIQRLERPLEEVTKIDDLKGENLRKFAIHTKTYAPLDEVKKSEDKHVSSLRSFVAGMKITALHKAAANNDVDAINNLLDIDRGSIDSETGRKWTPLHFAAARGHIEAVKLLLQRGANAVKITGDHNGNGVTPAELAASRAERANDPEAKIKFLEIQKILESHILNSKIKPEELNKEVNIHFPPSLSPTPVVKCLIANSPLYRDGSANESSPSSKNGLPTRLSFMNQS